MSRKKSSFIAENANAPSPSEVPEPRHRVIVEGRARRLQAFNLPHDIFCAQMGECSCSDQAVVTSVYSAIEQGQVRHLVAASKRVCATLSVRYGQRVAVPRAALLCPEIASALQRKWLRVRS